ncbi:MAG: hypothetical protein HC912_01325 [Saprospiraceae bacterium]|nr:hypothetical protein [Saprospiraceae bacterium]
MKNTSNLFIYRVNDNGLEVFMMKKGDEYWELPTGDIATVRAIALEKNAQIIELDPVEDNEEGIFEQAYAVEADWHDIPSLKSILLHDLMFVTDTVKKMVPDMMERGTFVAVKEAFKRVLPKRYQQLKELKDILTDRNLTKYL